MLVVEHEKGCPAALFGQDLPAVTVVRPYLGDPLPDTLDDHAGLVVLGGEMAAWDDEVAPWLPAVRDLLARAVTGRVPTLGICLGAQLLALATGGEVGRGPRGPEVGLTEVTARPGTDPFFGAVAADLGTTRWTVRQSHGDAVLTLPPGAELLVTGNIYPHQGFRVGEAAWGVQYHPEVTADGFAAWVARGVAKGRVSDPDAVLGPVRAAEPAQQRLARAHAAAFVQQLPNQ
ncbi:hypothetical protein JCM9957A_09050 [Kineosporia succinea]